MKQDNYVTVEKLKKELATLEKGLDKKMQLYLKISRIDTQVVVDKAIENFKQTLTNFADKMYSRIDPLLQELETNREHRIIATKDDYETKNRLDDVEKRIKIL